MNVYVLGDLERYAILRNMIQHELVTCPVNSQADFFGNLASGMHERLDNGGDGENRGISFALQQKSSIGKRTDSRRQ
jgi:hypothetical protein